MTIAQAEAEGFVLLTADEELKGYGGPVRLVDEADADPGSGRLPA
jgi:hypothetical protein